MLPTNVIVPVVFLATILLSVGIPLLIVWLVIHRRAQKWDEVFLPLGFSGHTYLISGRHYSLERSGKPVDIYVYRGPSMDVRCSVSVDANFQVLQKASTSVYAAEVLKKPYFESNHPDLESLAFFPADSTWLPDFLKRSPVARSINTLMTLGAGWATFRRVELNQGILSLYLYRSKNWNSFSLDQHNIIEWLDQMDILAGELLSANLTPLDEEVTAKGKVPRQKQSMLVASIVAAVLLILPACIFMVSILINMLTGNN